MLVLSRKKSERIMIGDNVVITIVDIGGKSVRIGIEAPDEVPIVREELYKPSTNKTETTSAAACA